jgi:hypothetical protein
VQGAADTIVMLALSFRFSTHVLDALAWYLLTREYVAHARA